jgi:inner membrane protein
MLPLGHVGITLGLAAIAAVVQHNITLLSQRKSEPATRPASGPADNPGKGSWQSTLARYGDLRFLILGSLLPDIVDKPVGYWLMGSGKMFCHTLLFLILISIAGLYIWRRHNKTWLLLISAGDLTHIILDGMWLNYRTLFWPLYGWSFPINVSPEWLTNIVYALFHMPSVYIPEIIGLAMLLYLACLLLYRKNVLAFLLHGRF